MTDARDLIAELGGLRQQRETLRAHVDKARGRQRREAMDKLRAATRRELLIEARLLPKASMAPAAPADEGQELRWWQK